MESAEITNIGDIILLMMGLPLSPLFVGYGATPTFLSSYCFTAGLRLGVT